MDECGDEKRKRMSVGLYCSCPANIKETVDMISQIGYHFIVTQITHPNHSRNILNDSTPKAIGRTDRVLKSAEWTRLIVGELTPSIDVDSEINHVREQSQAIFLQELGFASHLGIPAVWFPLTKPNNVQMAQALNEKLCSSFAYSVWINIPMVHPSRFSPICDAEYDTWEWWDEFRTYCNYDKRLGVVLDLCDVKHLAPISEINRWIGEPVKAIVIPTSFFLKNQHGKPVLSRSHQDIIQKFMTLDVQYVIKQDTEGDLSVYLRYLQFLGKKLYVDNTMSEFVTGCEDFLQNPLQPLTEHLETNIYEVFEKDQIKYDTYQNAVYKALESSTFAEDHVPVVMVVGAGRGPLVQAVLNVSYTLNRKVKVYAVEKNPYAINTLLDRVKNEWDGKVTLVHQDMRTYEPPEKADILVSELLGSFGDNELSPECLDGAQRFLKKSGVSIPCTYTSYISPVQSIKIYNEIKNSRPADKTLQYCYETPYVVHLANFYQIAPPQELFTFKHPNWSKRINNRRYKKLHFQSDQACVLTAFAGFFDTVLYKDVTLSIHPDTHTPDMVSWFPIVFPLPQPIRLESGQVVEVSFWRAESIDKVWYEWCLHAPFATPLMNANGRSYFIKKR